MTRIYLPQPLASQILVSLPEQNARHVFRVLRLSVGEELTVFNGEGGEYEAIIETANGREVRVRLGAFRPIERESPLQITLAQCVSKGGRMDYTIQKAVELGAQRIIPLLSDRSVVKLDATRWSQRGRHWQAVIAAACEQCQRNRIPELMPVQLLNSWILKINGPAIWLAPRAEDTLHCLPRPKAITVLIGPEGGLTSDEAEYVARQGVIPVRLGPRVLRTETAGAAALAAIQALWGDFI